MAEKNPKKDQNNIKTKTIQRHEESKDTSFILLLPILFIVAILPLIMRLHIYDANLSDYAFFANDDEYVDFFLYYKHLIFIALSAFMALIVIYKSVSNKRKLNYPTIFIPLTVYAFLALLSSLLSKYKYFSFHGIFEQFESIFAILGYCLTAYYAYLVVKTEREIKYIIIALLVGTSIMSLIGLTQITGNNFFSTPAGWRMISSREYWELIDSFQFNFSDSVYSTLYNPNYVGVYASLVLPILVVLAFVSKKLWHKIAFFASSLGVVISLIGSKSSTGIVSVIFGIILAIILFRRYLVKYFYISLPFIILIIIALLVFNSKSDNYLINQFHKVTNIQKSAQTLTEIQTTANNVIAKYNGNIFQVDYYITEDGIYEFNVYDGDFNPINKTTDSPNGPVVIQDSRFPGFVLTPCRNIDDTLAFSLMTDNKLWYFTNQVLDNTYYLINEYGKYDKPITAPSAIFTGYEYYASGRGYIWSRTIPLLKDRILLGSGADTFSMVFPHQDYVSRNDFGFGSQLISKPHNLYLQMGVQTGVISLIAFLAFYAVYFIWSLTIYSNGNFNSYISLIGVAILISTACYMVCGLANDSSITVAPLFWVFMGLGIAVNKLAKNEQVTVNK